MKVSLDDLKDRLNETALAYETVAREEMQEYGSIDRIYDCVRNSRNLRRKARNIERFESVY